MAKLIYIADNHDIHREAQEIELTFSDDLDIYEFKIMCKRLASTMGYHNDSIQRAFDNIENYVREQHNLSDVLDIIPTGSKVIY